MYLKVFMFFCLSSWGFLFLSYGQNRIPVAIPETLDLQSTLTYALENNFSILQAKQRIREQEGLIIDVRSQALPKALLDANYTHIDSGLSETFGGIFDPNTQNWNIGLTIRQALYKGGSVKAALHAQELFEEAVLYDFKSTINLAVQDVTTRYYDVLLARECIGVQEQNIELLKSQLQDAKNRFEVGAVSQFEVLRAEVELANAQPHFIQARNNFRLSIEELRQAMGFLGLPKEVTRVPIFMGNLDFTPIEIPVAQALDTAKLHRPELQQLELIVEAREQGIIIKRANRLPDVDLVGSYQHNKSTISSSFGDSLYGWTIGVQSSWAIFDGKSTEGRVLHAKSLLEQARLDLGQRTLEIEVEVRRAVHDLQEARELAQASVKVIDQAEESLRLANELYGAGHGTQLDVLQSQVALTESRLNQLQANHSYKVAEAGLAKALGNAIPYVDPEN